MKSIFAFLLFISASALAQDHQPYPGNACAVYQSLDVTHAPLLDWFSRTASSCSESSRREAIKQSVDARTQLKKYVTAGSDSSANDPVLNPAFRPSGANRGVGEIYFAAECAIRTCGGGVLTDQTPRRRESEDDPNNRWNPDLRSQPAEPRPPARPADDGRFTFEVCNQTAVKLWVSVVYQEGQTGIVRGWWSVDPGACRTIGRYPKGYFYYFAQTFGIKPARGTPMRGNLTQFCVEEREFRHDFGKTCAPHLRRGFGVLKATELKHTWTID